MLFHVSCFFTGLIVLFSCLLNIYYPLILYVSPNVDGLKFGITTKQGGVSEMLIVVLQKGLA